MRRAWKVQCAGRREMRFSANVTLLSFLIYPAQSAVGNAEPNAVPVAFSNSGSEWFVFRGVHAVETRMP